MPSEAQARKLFGQLKDVVQALDAVKGVVNQIAANSEVFVAGYHEHGAAIAALQSKVDRLMAVCPRLREDTNEFAKVTVDVDEREDLA